MNNWEELKWRGLVKDVSNEEQISKMINDDSITFYWGTDPTADSLHIGHYSSLVTAKRLMKMGHKPILLCGGATGRIGDPRPTTEREIIDIDVLNNNINCIRKQIDTLFEGKAKLVDNYDWFKGYEFVEFLRDVGKYINVNYMLDKDIIKRRLESGITYAEFSYTMMQGYDFVKMYKDMNCVMQVEGSDQWGNITTGIELGKKMLGVELFGFTMPLILDANGNKFGKSEGNALWIDKNKTSSYEIYQYLINTDDTKVYEYLKVYTFLTPSEIDDLMEKHNKNPEERLAQKTLSYEFIKDLHGVKEADLCKQISEFMFGENDKMEILKNLKNDELQVFQSAMGGFSYSGENLFETIVNSGLASSNSEARNSVSSGAIFINEEKIDDPKFDVNANFVNDKFLLLRKGKKNFKLILK